MSDHGSMDQGAEESDRPVREMLRAAVDGVLSQNDLARDAHRSLVQRGRTEEEARETIARVLLAVMAHVQEQSDRLRDAGGGAGLRREAFRRLRDGESVEEILGRDG